MSATRPRRFLYALLVGINEYRAVPPLRGCVNDAERALECLGAAIASGTELRPVVLRDGEATRDAVVDAIRSHLGQAGPDDTALFWFSGHGSEHRVPAWAWFAEPGGYLQTLACADSRSQGLPDLWDKELAVLLDDVGRRAGHVAVVLDSCHSGGASRRLNAREPAARARAVDPQDGPRSPESLIPELVLRREAGAAPPPGGHIELSASLHGIPTGDGVRVEVHGPGPLHESAVTHVFAERSLVDPLGGWAPSPEHQFSVVLTGVPLPRLVVAVGGDAAGAARMRASIATAGPDGRASPYLRPLAPDHPAETPDLRATVASAGTVTVTDRHGERLRGRIADIADLEHLARWQLVLDLDNPAAALAGAVRIEVVAAGPGDVTAPETRAAERPADDGAYHVRYQRDGDRWLEPHLFIRLHNTADRPLYCVLLDLTPGFGIHADLFPGDFIAPGGRGAALAGRRIRAFLPHGVAPAPGTRVRDRLKLIVAEQQFSAQPFRLPELGTTTASRRAPGPLAVHGLVERLGAAVHRNLGDAHDADGAYDWTTEGISLITEVP